MRPAVIQETMGHSFQVLLGSICVYRPQNEYTLGHLDYIQDTCP